ncbi:LLM class F420-dependent oxidoreductase [Nocardia stercoris]|uniref:LLM class F420-dependent oxidoreductase n=1 Tax=Nocardia stercoris TaxID=2483361 RepID=A0A3M2KQG3_9NOCA|nr:LLM class F420-dependent oxidoreductase [Nocardia stercoris]RMI27887.1 LLM class F420-dependent oxidoreductase [Nocardia stercoris]
MEVCIVTEPQQGADYDTLLGIAQTAEDLGFDGFFRSDHYLAMDAVDGLPGPTDAWITLAGLARETSRIRLGTLVSAATFRLPGPLAIAVAQVDRMSGGRVELGLGTGWFAEEHAAYGIPFPPNRFDHFEEQLAIITGLWDTPIGRTFDFDGVHYRLTDSPALPKPVQDPLPIIVGGQGPHRTPWLAARYATEFNMPYSSLSNSARQFDRVRAAARTAGRALGSLTFSNALVTCVATDRGEVARQAALMGFDPAELQTTGLTGSPAEVVDRIGRYAELGSSRVYLLVAEPERHVTMELIADRVLPQLG